MNGKQLKNSILQWAIQGKLVPQDPNDEPASVLLERIREEKARLVKEKKIKKDKNESIIFRGDDNSHYEKFADGTVKCIDDEIPFEIPQSWCWVRGKHIFLPMQSIKPIGEYFTYIDIDAVNNKVNIIDKAKNILCSEAPSRASRKLEANSILFSMVRPYLRNITMVGEEYKDAIASTGFYVVTPSMLLFTKYIFNLLLSSYVVDGLNQFMKGDNSPSINNEHIEGFLYPVPPVNEQIKIVAEIEKIMPFADKYEESQEALNKLNAGISDKLRKSVLQEAIQGKLVPQDPNDEPASVLLERIKEEKTKLFKEGKLKKKDLVDSVIFKGDDNKYYETIDGVTECIEEEIPYDLPSNWAWTRLGNIAKMTIGKTPARGDQRYWSNGEYSWVSISDMKDLGVISATKERISAIAVKELMGNISPKGSLLMSFKLTVGRTSLLDMDAYHNEAIVTVLPLIDECNTFRNYLFRTLPLLSVAGDSKDAIKGKTLNSQSLSRLLIPLPPMSEQERIVQELQRVTSLMN